MHSAKLCFRFRTDTGICKIKLYRDKLMDLQHGAYFSLLAFIDYVGSIDLISILNYDNNLVIKICSISLQGNLHNLLFLKNMVE